MDKEEELRRKLRNDDFKNQLREEAFEEVIKEREQIEEKKMKTTDKKKISKNKKIAIGGLVSVVLIVSSIAVLNKKDGETESLKTEDNQVKEEANLETYTEEKYEEEKTEKMQNMTGNRGKINEGYKKLEEADSYRFSYTAKGYFETDKVIMDNVLSAKYDKGKGYIKEFTKENTTNKTYTVMYDPKNDKYLYKKEDLNGYVNESLYKTFENDFEWIQLEKSDIQDRKLLTTSNNFKEKKELLSKLKDADFKESNYSAKDGSQGVTSSLEVTLDKTNIEKYREYLMFLGKEQQYISVFDIDQMKIKYLFDQEDNFVKEIYDFYAIKSLGTYHFILEQNYYGINEEVNFEEQIVSEDVLDAKSVEKIKKQIGIE